MGIIVVIWTLPLSGGNIKHDIRLALTLAAVASLLTQTPSSHRVAHT
jgi:hypothetical protein